MSDKKNTILTSILVCLCLVNITLFSTGQDISAVKGLRLFDGGNYEEAEYIFRKLLDEEPDNTMLNYYYGACRTENGNFSQNDLNFLLKAGKTVTPHRINYYLGLQYHALNNWEQAIKLYNLFRISVPENEQKELNLNEKIQQCYDKVNPFLSSADSQAVTEPIVSREVPEQEQTVRAIESETTETYISPDRDNRPEEITEAVMPVEESSPEKEEIKAPSSEKTQLRDQKSDHSRRVLPDLPGVKTTLSLPEGEFIEFQINNSITYLHTSHFRTDEGKELFKKALSMQKQLDKKMQQTDLLRKEYLNSADENIKSSLGKEILALENETYSLREEMPRLFSKCRNFENEYWQRADKTEINNLLIELDKIKSLKNGQSTGQKIADQKEEPVIIIETDELFAIPDMGKKANQPPELVYKIQLGAYSKGIPAYKKRLFDKLSVIRKIDNYTDEEGVVVYTTGNLTNMEDAEKMENQVRQEGIKDATIVPYFQGKRITLEQAEEIESGNDK